jgi:hypothetical protein
MDKPENVAVDLGIENTSGISFYSRARRQQMRYLYPDSGHHWAGWILFKNVDGQWVSLRKATDSDVAELSAAVVTAHHNPAKSYPAKSRRFQPEDGK